MESLESSPRSWLNTHSHEPNPIAPQGDGSFTLAVKGIERSVDLDTLRALRFAETADCYIASTGHSRTGPFRFGGVTVTELLVTCLPADTQVAHADFISADGYGTRLDASIITGTPPPLLAYRVDGAPLLRSQGLVRLVVPSETDAALHQVKWLTRIEVTLFERT